MIVRSVEDDDQAILDQIAQHLADCAMANQILRAKGYGVSGTPIHLAVAQVPEAFQGRL